MRHHPLNAKRVLASGEGGCLKLATQKSYDEWYASMLARVCAKQRQWLPGSGRISRENFMNHGLKALTYRRSINSASCIHACGGDRKRKSINEAMYVKKIRLRRL